MASKIVTTQAFCRASYPALAEPKKLNEGDELKYRLQAMFAKDNVYNHSQVGTIDSHPYDIIDALNEVCFQEFGVGVQSIEDVTTLKESVGVQFPPSFKDGDRKIQKDDNGRPIPGQFDEATKGYWLLNLTSRHQPGVVDHQEDAIDPSKVYAGCWVRIQVEVSAYFKDRSPIVAIDLLAVQYVYDDESLGGGRGARPDPTKSFGVVANGNADTSGAKRMGSVPTRPSAPNTPARPGAPTASSAPQRPGAPNSPARPGAPTTPPAKPVKELVSISDYTIEQLRGEYQMSDDDIVNGGYGEWREVVKTPSKPVPPKPAPIKKPSGPRVEMNPDSEFTYEELKNDHGWTDEEIVNGGYGQFVYTDPNQ